jgi:hypothetical protein
VRLKIHFTDSKKNIQQSRSYTTLFIQENFKNKLHSGQIKLGPKLIYLFIVISFGIAPIRMAYGFDFSDLLEISSAYITHLTLHELGHQLVADEVGVTNHNISFFTQKKGSFYFGVSTYDSIPQESRLPYAMGGERINSLTFEYNLRTNHHNPTTFTKAMLFFDSVNFLGYTLIANYVITDNHGYDPTLIRLETGMSKEMLLSLVLTKTILNTWRIYHPETRWSPILDSDSDSIWLQLRYEF